MTVFTLIQGIALIIIGGFAVSLAILARPVVRSARRQPRRRAR